MKDPSRSIENAIKEYQKHSVIPFEDVRMGAVFHQPITKEIWARLNQYRICKLVGPPRSGKTYVAFSIGLEIENGKSNTLFHEVRYLNLADIEEDNDVDKILKKMGKRWLFIIDNCHLAPSFHGCLIRLLQSQWKDVGLLLIETRFPPGKDEGEPELSKLLQIRLDPSNAPIDTKKYLIGTATGMLETHLRRYFEIDSECTGSTLVENVQAKGGRFDEADYKAMLKTSTEFKSLKGNLRFLSWRLLAWKPRECYLRELSSQEILETVRQILVYPFPNSVGTLERISCLAQWELPYLRRTGDDPPAGIQELERANVIALKGTTGWQMDSTDAYLVMLTKSVDSGQDWKAQTLELMTSYLALYPQQIPYIVENIWIQTNIETRWKLITQLLQIPELVKMQKEHFVNLARRNELSFIYIAKLLHFLLRHSGEDKAERNLGLNIATELMSNEIMLPIGRDAHANSSRLQQISWFLIDINRLGTDSDNFRKLFFDGYGRQELLSKVIAYSALSIRQNMVNSLRQDPEFKTNPKLHRQLNKLVDEMSAQLQSLGISRLLTELMRGCIETGRRRYNKIHVLKAMDKQYILDKLKNERKPATRLQYLLHISLWLDPRQATYLAGIMPQIWANLTAHEDTVFAHEDDAAKLGFLVRNCWYADNQAARDLANILLNTPLPTLITPAMASGIGRFFTTIELVRSGSIHEYCSRETNESDYLMKVCEVIKPDEVDTVLIALLAFAPSVLEQIIERHREQLKILLVSDTSNESSWIRYAIINLLKIPGFNLPTPEIPKSEDIATCMSAQAILVIYALQICKGCDFVLGFLESLSALRQTAPWIPLLIGRATLPLDPEQVIKMIRLILLEGYEPKASALDSVILLMNAMKSVDWPTSLKFDPNNNKHCALQMAIHDAIIRIEVDQRKSKTKAILNPDHHLVKSTLETVNHVVKPVRNIHIDLSDWDAALSGILLTKQSDYYRAKLLEIGLLSWEVNRESESPIITFGTIEKLDSEQLRTAMGLSIS
ncbi:hypothetical protein ES708_02343 [subsurface metagenome]